MIKVIGGFLLLFVAGCTSEKVQTPEQVSMAFWSALSNNNTAKANSYCTNQPLQSLTSSQSQQLDNARFNTGKLIVDGSLASVEILVTNSNNNSSTFTSYLVKENNSWKVDCHRSISSLSTNALTDLFDNLNIFGEKLNDHMEKQLPMIEKNIEKGIEAFNQELKQQIDALEKSLEKPATQKQSNKSI